MCNRFGHGTGRVIRAQVIDPPDGNALTAALSHVFVLDRWPFVSAGSIAVVLLKDTIMSLSPCQGCSSRQSLLSFHTGYCVTMYNDLFKDTERLIAGHDDIATGDWMDML